MALLDQKTLGPTRLGFADEKDLDAFIDKLDRFEKGELAPDAWKAFRLVNGVYSERQEGDAMMIRVEIPHGVLTAGQLRALAGVAEKYSTGRGHITTRQNVQFHFVKLDDSGAALTDIGLLARVQDGKAGFRVTIGGGLSTLRRAGILAHDFAPAEDVLEIADAVLRVFHRTVNRHNKHKARLKFVVDQLGPEA